jgi:hypothetical protein
MDAPRGRAAGTIWQAVDPNAAAFLRKCDFCMSIQQICKLPWWRAAATISRDFEPAFVYKISLFTGPYDAISFGTAGAQRRCYCTTTSRGDAFFQIDVVLGTHVPSIPCSVSPVLLQN